MGVSFTMSDLVQSLSPMSEMPIAKSVLLIEPNEIVRIGLAALLDSLESVSKVETLTSSSHVDDFIANSSIDILIVSSEITEAIDVSLRRDQLKVLLVVHDIENYQFPENLDLLADGLIPLKNMSVRKLEDTLNRLDSGEFMLPTQLARRMLQRPRHAPSQHALTQRELQVLTFLSEGYCNKQIGPRMGISEHGVKRHVGNILAKLNCPNRTQAVSYAHQQGLLAQPPSGCPAK